MKEHLPFAMAWWHNLCANGKDMFSEGTADKSFGAKSGTFEHAKAKVDAGIEFMQKLNIEANHATLAGHTFQHELRVSAINGMLGSIDANQGDMLLGWDTDEFPFNVYDTTLAMYEVLKAGGINGGFNFDSKNHRPSNTFEDMFHVYILGMDTFALGLIKAAALIEDGRIDEFVKQRYASYTNTEIGRKIRDHSTTLAELADCASQMKKPTLPASGRQELLEQVMNELLFT